MSTQEALYFLRKKLIAISSNDPGGPYVFLSNMNWERHLKEVRKALDIVPKKGKILDVGCGGGHTTCIAKILRKDIEVYGIDIIKKAFWEELKVFGGEYIISDAENCCFLDESFDMAFSFGVIEHTKNPLKFLKEINRVLKPGSTFFIYDLPTRYAFSEAVLGHGLQFFTGKKMFFHNKRYTKKEVEEIFSKAGFSTIIGEDFIIPTQVDRISRYMGIFFNKNYKKIEKVDKIILKTPLKIFSQAYFVEAKKL